MKTEKSAKHYGIMLVATVGTLDWYFRPLSISLGEGRWWFTGVIRRQSMARCGSEPVSFAFVKTCLTVCTILSINPLIEDTEVMKYRAGISNFGDSKLAKLLS